MQTLQSRLLVAEAEKTRFQTQAAEATAEINRRAALAETEAQSLRAENQRLTGDLANERSERTSLQTALQIANSTTASLQSQVARLAEDNADLVIKNSDMSAKEVDLKNTIADQIYTINRISDEVARQSEYVQAQAGELTAAQDKVSDLRGLLEAVGVKDDMIVVAPTEIHGSVTNATTTSADLTLLELNVGERDGVKEGMVFTVRGQRGGKDVFLGRAEITFVDVNASVARVRAVGRAGWCCGCR